MMSHKTTNTYEAAWYLMNGAKLTGVEFEMTIHGLQYSLTLEGVSDQYRTYWMQYRPIGNIRRFSLTRIQLKKEIRKYKDEYEAKVSQRQLQK